MFIFGIDIPLVELFLVVTIVTVISFSLIVYIIIRMRQINKKLDHVYEDEVRELRTFQEFREDAEEIRHDASKELQNLNAVKSELNDLLMDEHKELASLKSIKDLEAKIENEEETLEKVSKKRPSRKVPKVVKHARKKTKNAIKKAKKITVAAKVDSQRRLTSIKKGKVAAVKKAKKAVKKYRKKKR